MLRQRAIVVILLLPVFIGLIVAGGWYYSVAVALALGLAAAEYGRMFRHHGLRPALPVIVPGVVLIALARHAFGFEFTPLLLSLLCLAGMAWHLVDYERGAPRSATDFNVTLTGTLYLGWIGAYLISLRNLPEGQWWLLLALPAIWLADTAAYFVGRAIGRHPFSPRLSPNKTWEGYLAGVAVGGLGGAGLASVWSAVLVNPPNGMDLQGGAILGTTLGVLAPLGDLGISMLKREIQVKDTGRLLPGHGGLLDRMDSWLWAAVIGFYVVSWLMTR